MGPATCFMHIAAQLNGAGQPNGSTARDLAAAGERRASGGHTTAAPKSSLLLTAIRGPVSVRRGGCGMQERGREDQEEGRAARQHHGALLG